MPIDMKSLPISAESQTAELEMGMRRSFAPRAAGHTQARRFSKDGDVRVVVLRSRRDDGRATDVATIRSAEDTLVRAEFALATAQKTIRDLQTKLAHAELAQDDLREDLRRVEQQRRTLETTLADQTNAREKVEGRLRKEVVGRAAAEQRIRILLSAADPAQARNPKPLPLTTRAHPDAVVQPPRMRRAHARTAPFAEDQEPVDWWSKHEMK